LNAEINKVVNTPEVKEAWAKQGAVPMAMTLEQFDKFLREDIVKWAKVVKLSAPKWTDDEEDGCVSLCSHHEFFVGAVAAQACPEKNLLYWQAFPAGASPISRRATSSWC